MNHHSVFIPHLTQGIVLDASNSEELTELQIAFSTNLCTLVLKTSVADSAKLHRAIFFCDRMTNPREH
jgi:hypothetical protein